MFVACRAGGRRLLKHTSRKYKRRSAGRLVSSGLPQYSAVSQSLPRVSITGRSLCRESERASGRAREGASAAVLAMCGQERADRRCARGCGDGWMDASGVGSRGWVSSLDNAAGGAERPMSNTASGNPSTQTRCARYPATSPPLARARSPRAPCRFCRRRHTSRTSHARLWLLAKQPTFAR